MNKKHSVIILEKDLPRLKQLLKEKRINIGGKKFYQIGIEYIQPNKFHDKIYKRNWSFALDIMQNGHLFEEVYVLVLKNKEDFKTLERIQQMVIMSACNDLSNILD